MQADAIVNSSFSKYQQVFYDNFNWAVLENALKWRKIEQTRVRIVTLILRSGAEMGGDRGSESEWGRGNVKQFLHISYR